MKLCTLHAATVLSRGCRADFGRPLTKKVMSHLRDGPGVTAPSRANIVPLIRVWNPPPSVTPPLKMPDLRTLLRGVRLHDPLGVHPSFGAAGSPQVLENTTDVTSRAFPEFCLSQYGLSPFLFFRSGLVIDQPELVMIGCSEKEFQKRNFRWYVPCVPRYVPFCLRNRKGIPLGTSR